WWVRWPTAMTAGSWSSSARSRRRRSGRGWPWGPPGGGRGGPPLFPGWGAAVPEVVERSLVAPAMAWVISAGQTAQIVGPALGGLLYAFGPGAAYFTPAGLFILAGAPAAAVRE